MKISSKIVSAVYEVTRVGMCIEIVFRHNLRKVLLLVGQGDENFPICSIRDSTESALRQCLHNVYNTSMPVEYTEIIKPKHWVDAFVNFAERDGTDLIFPLALDVIRDDDSGEYIGMYHVVVSNTSKFAGNVLSFLGTERISNTSMVASYTGNTMPRWLTVKDGWAMNLVTGVYGGFNTMYLWLRTQKGLLGSEVTARTATEISNHLSENNHWYAGLYQCSVLDSDNIAFPTRAFKVVER